MEKPVVATDAGGVRELVGDAGIVVPTKNHGGARASDDRHHAAEQGIARRVRAARREREFRSNSTWMQPPMRGRHCTDS